MEFRLESDSIGAIRVPADRYWGAQTQRSLEHFRIGGHRFPLAVLRAFGLVKRDWYRTQPRGDRAPCIELSDAGHGA
jgi:fumarate hydratase class II